MSNESNNMNKDTAKSLGSYSDLTHKGTNALLDTASQINKWYNDQLNKITESEIDSSRLETNVDNSIEEIEEPESLIKIETKVENYEEIQTDNVIKANIINNKATNLQTQVEDELSENIIEEISDNNEVENLSTNVNNKNSKIPKRIATSIKGVKLINNVANKIVKTGQSINTSLNEGGLKSFEKSSNRIMTKPIKKVSNKITHKAGNLLGKAGKKVANKYGKKVIEKTTNLLVKLLKLTAKLVANVVKLILSMLPQIAPVIIIIVIIAALGNFLNFSSTQEADNINFDKISKLMIEIEDEKIQAIYNEFLKNMGTPYLMDHSNLSHTECMEYYDCSSWVIHCLAHCGIKTIANTGAQGIYNNHCTPINVEERKAGDMIFLKDTYDTGEPGSISHIGIYMGELTINGDSGEWVIDTGSNPDGVRIRKYTNGWWNGPNFYGFARLK